MSINSTDPRRVLSQAADIWRDIYVFLATYAKPENKLGGGPSYKKSIPKNLLQDLYDARPAGSETITFWMGMVNSPDANSPLVILSNATGTTIQGSAISDGQWVADGSTLQADVNSWESFCLAQGNNQEYLNDYVFVRFYSYPWSEIISLTATFTHDLFVEMVAHTIGADNQFFEADIKDTDHKTEGYIALELLLTPDDGVGAPNPDHYNFMMPCPKICPQ